MKDKYILTAESVTAGHPDKLCDTIADSILDAVDKIFAMAGREDVILSFGSLSFIGEITTIVKTQEEKNS